MHKVVDAFVIKDYTSGKDNFKIKNNGFVYVRELNVRITNFPDYVFDKNYKLNILENLEQSILTYHHLPNVPAAADIEKNGVNLGELNRLQFEKIEELTLYIIELEKRLKKLETEKK
jgi:hypothetical protein